MVNSCVFKDSESESDTKTNCTHRVCPLLAWRIHAQNPLLAHCVNTHLCTDTHLLAQMQVRLHRRAHAQTHTHSHRHSHAYAHVCEDTQPKYTDRETHAHTCEHGYADWHTQMHTDAHTTEDRWRHTHALIKTHSVRHSDMLTYTSSQICTPACMFRLKHSRTHILKHSV